MFFDPLQINLFLKRVFWPLKTIDGIVPKSGNVLELGCGEGIICAYLSKSSADRVIKGIDFSGKKIKQAKKNYSSPNLIFQKHNALRIKLLDADCIIMSDFLHHLNRKSQVYLFSKIPKTIQTVIIKEIDKNEKTRSAISRIFDMVFYPKDKINYRTALEWEELLRGKNFKTYILRTNRFFPGSTTLIVGTRK